MREESEKLFDRTSPIEEVNEEFIKEYRQDVIEDECEAFNILGDIEFKDSAGKKYNINNLRPWWAYLFEVITPDDVADDLDFAVKNGSEYQLRVGDTQMCRVDVSDNYAPMQVIHPELAVQVFKGKIYLDINTEDYLEFSSPVVHYSEDGESAIVYVTVAELDVDNPENYFHYTYAIVCVRTKED